MQQSDYRVVAKHSDSIVGFTTAISDGVLAAYIPFLEVLPEFQKSGIGSELTTRMLHELQGHYMINLLCDEELQSFYAKHGMTSAAGMRVRNYQQQAGRTL